MEDKKIYILIMLIMIFFTLYKLGILKKNIKEEKKNNQFAKIEEFESNILYEIQDKLEGFIEVSKEDQRFLNGIIRKVKPKKLVEIGVAYGGTSALILNAIKDVRGSKLYSIDINKYFYRDESKLTGFIIKEKFKEISGKWTLLTGGIPSQFIEKIGKGVS